MQQLWRLVGDPRLIRFGIIGVCATAIQVSLFAWFEHYLPADVAAVVAFVPAMLFNHALNHYWNFRPERCRWGRSFVRYMPVSLLGMALSGMIMSLATRVFGWSSSVGLVLIVLSVPLVTFTLARTVAFVPAPVRDVEHG